MDDIPEVDASLIDNDDIFQPKWWEIIAVVVAGTALYMLELPTVWWVSRVFIHRVLDAPELRPETGPARRAAHPDARPADSRF